MQQLDASRAGMNCKATIPLDTAAQHWVFVRAQTRTSTFTAKELKRESDASFASTRAELRA